MILLYIQFDPSGYGKTYKYLLVNPGHYKIDNTKPLVYYQGATAKGPITHIMYATKAEKVTVLPTVVSKQIVLLDEHNHVEIQTLGKVATAEVKEIQAPKISPAQGLSNEWIDVLASIAGAYQGCYPRKGGKR